MLKQLSVVIPAYNEADGIRSTIERVQSMSLKNNLDCEIIVVDDGSSDDTASIASSFGVSVLQNPVNAGYGRSLQRGIRFAKFEYVAITDADGTYPIEDIPALIKMMDEGLDMAVGARQGSAYWKNWWKSPARIVFRVIAEFVAGRRIPDINSGLRIMRKSSVIPFLNQTCSGFSFTTSITLILMLNGFFVSYRPIAYAERIGSSKVRHFHDTLRTAQILTSIISIHNPIKLALLIDIVLIIIAISVGGIYLIWSSSYILALFLSLIQADFVAIPIIFMLGCFAELLRIK